MRPIDLQLHKQFGHSTAINFIKLICSAGIDKSDLEREIDRAVKNCEVCVHYKKVCLRPVVSMPMATRFNAAAAMDLKVWGKLYLLVMVDMVTRYCGAAVVRDKKARTIISCFFRYWICFSSNKGCWANNGGSTGLIAKCNID